MNPRGVPDFNGKRVTVAGLGLFTGGVETVRFLAKRGAIITVTDLRKEEELRESLDAIGNIDCRLRLGGHVESDFAETDFVVANPAVPPGSPFIALARERGIPVEQEITLFFRLCRAPVVGVTGSNGKTTTTVMVAKFLEAAGRRVHLGGNVGQSLLNHAESFSPEDVVVLELSSAQLAALRDARISPQVGLVTNLTPNHLDWHGTFEHYRWSKAGVFASQDETGTAILSADDPGSAALEPEAPGRVLKFGWEPREELAAAVMDGGIAVLEGGEWRRIIALSDIPLPGKFNVMNVLAALTALSACGEKADKSVLSAVRSFEPIPHRLEKIGTWAGVAYYNDSIATTPESAIAALEAVEGKKVLIAGGYDKGLDYSELAAAVVRYAESLVTVGAAGDKIAAAVEAIDAAGLVHRALNLSEAVATASALAGEGCSVLLSPAAASYDEFRNFTERGDMFRKYVADLHNGK